MALFLALFSKIEVLLESNLLDTLFVNNLSKINALWIINPKPKQQLGQNLSFAPKRMEI